MASIYDKAIMSETDLKKLAQIENQWQNADSKNRARLHNEAESLRNTYGYSGGEDGGAYKVLDSATAAVSNAEGDYRSGINGIISDSDKSYENQSALIDKATETRLREAYAKSLQNSLGLDQSLRADGITGGLSESVKAGLINDYINARDGIYSDASTQKNELYSEKESADRQTKTNMYETLLDSAKGRADRLTDADNRTYERSQDAVENALNKAKFDYQKQSDKAELDYKKERDKNDLEYQKEKDKNDLEYKNKALSKTTSGSTESSTNSTVSNYLQLLKNGYYSDEIIKALGLDPDSVSKSGSASDSPISYVWDMLSSGVYDDSFPAIVGFSADVLKAYAKNKKNGY